MRRKSANSASSFFFLSKRLATDTERLQKLSRFVRENPTQGEKTAPPSYLSEEDRQARGLPRAYEAALKDVDPLGGMWHRDYFRDPRRGSVPKFAPRNFADGGTVAYPHSMSDSDYTMGKAERFSLDHDVARGRLRAAEDREVLRSVSDEEANGYLVEASQKVKPHFVRQIEANASLRRHDIFRSLGVRKDFDNETMDRVSLAEASRSKELLPSPEPHDVHSALAAGWSARHFSVEEEVLRRVHGIRAKERADFESKRKFFPLSFRGYDMDRFRATRDAAGVFGVEQPPDVVPASSMSEAQTELRKNSVSSRDKVVTKAFARNTTSLSPQIGEDLAEAVSDSLIASERVECREEMKVQKEKLGLGRQGPLVQEGGPDRRKLQLQKNDERLLHAASFGMNAYRQTPTDSHVNPHARTETSSGVGHLLRTGFDISRRTHRLATQKDDITERNTVFYGIPIRQQIDELVKLRRNARHERPFEYFLPDVHYSDMKLRQMNRDVEGFLFLRSRPSRIEWDLFVRYRAHHQQRRLLALKHGLEPKKNETISERDFRRLKLDKLCEETPFDPSIQKMHYGETMHSSTTIREWFGFYLLPTPSLVERTVREENFSGLKLNGEKDSDGQPLDDREHLLSARYLNVLLTDDAYNARVHRQHISETFKRVPDPVIKYQQSSDVLRYFDHKERAMYEKYLKMETDKHVAKWTCAFENRRWLEAHGKYGKLVDISPRFTAVEVVFLSSGARMFIDCQTFKTQIDESKDGSIIVDGEHAHIVERSRRDMFIATVELEDGSRVQMQEEEFLSLPLEVEGVDRNQHLNWNLPDYSYNRANYIETQDYIWEERTQKGEEGWSPATHTDGLHPGLPVLARRQLGDLTKQTVGDFQRGIIVEYLKQPFFNPDPRTVQVSFVEDNKVESVLLSHLLIWQCSWAGPERTVPEETRLVSSGVNRYVNYANPLEKPREPHFLDRYRTLRSSDTLASVKAITDLDVWTFKDLRRAENHRLLSTSHRNDFVRLRYYPHYTPWDYILTQEADQPLIQDQLREDNVGPSYFFKPNRFYRFKRRPTGYLRNFETEIRDVFQYIDGVTPWEKAQKVRKLWEVREHHPIPLFHRPELAMHRNTASLLPTLLWDSDKKTGKIKALKDSVKDYKTTSQFPSWVQF